MRKTPLAALLLAAAVPFAASAESRYPGIETGIGVGVAFGAQTYGNGGSNGTSGAIQLSYRAFLDTEAEGRWLFELGFEHARSFSEPEIKDEGRERRITSNGVFYRQSWLGWGGFYAGGRVGIARVRGAADKENLDLVFGLQTGYRFTDWFELGIEAVVAEPSFGEGMKPGDLRGVMTVTF